MKCVDERNMKKEGAVQTDERRKKAESKFGALQRQGQKVGRLAFI